VILNESNIDSYVLEPGVLPHPNGLVVLEGIAYTIDTGELVAIPIDDQGLSAGLPAAPIRPPEGQVEELPVGELLTLALNPEGNALLVLDKRGDLYRYEPTQNSWTIERAMDQRRTAPNPVPVAIASYNGRSYTLDVGYSQIWRYPYDDVLEGYLPGEQAPWGRIGTEMDLTRGIDLGVDGNVYVLLREGTSGPEGLARFTGSPAERDVGFAIALDMPTQLYASPEKTDPLYVVDQEGHRLRELERKTGEVRYTYSFSQEEIEIRAVYAQHGKLYIATPGTLYMYPGTGKTHLVTGGRNNETGERLNRLFQAMDLAVLHLPIAGMRYLPERDSLLPGSPRVYRYGIHQGWDIYKDTVGIDVPYGTPVHAIADGTIERADHGFQEVSPAEWKEMAAVCAQLHYTPMDILDRFRGQQVWIDHGQGVLSRYVHLSGIEGNIITGTTVSAGQIIGYVGNSGTSDGAAGNQQAAHLHLEITIDGHYLGEGLTITEVRRFLQRLFFP
jgi:murein DD-endopeptidase MepM/ murein hydrolase activator NlpD